MTSRNSEEGPERPGMDGAPESVRPHDEEDDFLMRCERERDTMTAQETSDCAGAEIADSYENEEDGGS